jgi:tetratricopeptide (TPR) repeat protein/CHAT domain-containing protein
VKKTLPVLFILFAVAGSVILLAQASPGDALSFFQQGEILYGKGDLDGAIEKFEAAKRSDPERAPTWKKLGDVYLDKGNHDTAIVHYNEAIKLYRETNRENHECYAKRGQAYYGKGDYDNAIEDFSQAIRLDRRNRGYWNNRGEIYRSKGEYEAAIRDFSEAIKIDRRFAMALNNMGLAYYGMENYDRAIENFNRAIRIDGRHVQAWNNRGSAWLEKGNYNRAIADFTRAINSGTGNEYALVYSNRSRAYLHTDYRKALADCERALEIDPDFAPAFNNLANTYREMGEYERALAAYRNCLDKAQQSVNMNDISVYAWYLAGLVYNNYPYLRGDIKTHSFWSEFAGRRLTLDGIERGIRNAENIRQNLGTRGAGLMAQMIYLYYAGVDLEVTMGSVENAFLYSESLRSRGFLEQVGAEAAIRLDGVEEAERTRFNELRADIERQQAIISTYDSAKLEGEGDERYRVAVGLRKDAEERLAALDRRIGSRVPRYTELRNPRPVTLNDAMAYCGDDRAVLEYVIWDASKCEPIKGFESWTLRGTPAINSYCLVITKGGVRAVPLDSGFDYPKAIQELRLGPDTRHPGCSKKNSAEGNYERPRNNLYDKLIKPVLPYINNVKNITIVPDGELAFLPFDILRENNREGTRNFGDEYAISLSPSLSVSILAHRERNNSLAPVLLFANDIYAGRDYQDGLKWGNLSGTIPEIDNLERLFNGKNLRSSPYRGAQATAARVRELSSSNELRRYPIIHFACHGYFNRENPTRSGLLLHLLSDETGTINGSSGYLTVSDIASLDLNARMVILSACETGLGQANVGEGMVGLARAFMVAGAGSVGVSLWAIDDDVANSFMEKLYRKVLEEGKHFREAYKEVKKEIQSIPRYGKPFYWAPFTMYE